MTALILYALLPIRSNSSRTLRTKVNVYEELKNLYATGEICEQILDQLLRDLNQSIGNQLEKQQVKARGN